MKKIIKCIIIFIVILIFMIIAQDDDKLIVCIDAGHGGIDVGAVNGDRYEKDDNLKIAKLVKHYLEEQDVKTIMTRENDKNLSLRQRCKMANLKKADLFISIHRNSAEEGKGVEIWTSSEKQTNDLQLANTILDNLKSVEIQTNRGVKSGTAKGEETDYYVLKNTNMASCLIELGFITNEKDNELFDKNVDAYAKAIAEAIIKEITY